MVDAEAALSRAHAYARDSQCCSGGNESPIPIRFVTLVKTTKPCSDPACKREGCVETERHYLTPSGEKIDRLAPGDAYFLQYHDPGYEHCWSNCDGRHLFVELPTGRAWNVDSRCSNCTLPQDRLHRCWVRHSDPATGAIHVDKIGLTCSAGAGSIAVDGWHGFLHNGALRQC
jgi:hypothetical protein